MLGMILKLYNVGIANNTPLRVGHKIRLINGLCLLGVLILLIFGLIDAIRQSWLEVVVDVASCPPLLVPMIFNALRKYESAKFAFVVVTCLVYLMTILALGAIFPIFNLFPIILGSICAVFDVKTEPKSFWVSICLAGVSLFVGWQLPKVGMIMDLSQEETLPYFVLVFNILSICWMMIFFNINLNRSLMQVAKQFEEREQEVSALHQVGKFAALGQLAAGIAHEINNPLAIIRGKLQILAQEASQNKSSPERLTNQLEGLIKTTSRISSITQSMLTLARADQGQKSIFAASDIINDAISLVRESFSKRGILINLNIADGLEHHRIEGNLGPLQQVLMNLLSNSRDALLDNRPLEDSRDAEMLITVAAYLSDEYLIIKVEDNGPGVPDELAERIMEPFFTTKEVGKGTGLGLSLSKSIMEASGGRLELARRRNPTTFMMSIPCSGLNAAQSN